MKNNIQIEQMIKLSNISLAITKIIQENSHAAQKLCDKIDKSNGQIKRALVRKT